MLAYDLSTTPINNQSKIIEERYYEELVNTARNTTTIPVAYIQQVPNIKSKNQSKPISNRMARFRKAGLIGCLNDTGITSINYKDTLSESVDQKSNT